MEKSKIIEGNCLIARHGDVPEKDGMFYVLEGELPFEEDALEYHMSWCWLIPEVRRFLNDLDYYKVLTRPARDLIFSKIHRALGALDIVPLWKELVDGIEQFNKGKTQVGTVWDTL